MSYSVKNTAGQTIANVPDRNMDTTSTSLTLVGYNVSNYGLPHNENFIRLLEHFANDISPENPIAGQMWFDTTTQMINLYAGGQWVPITAVGTPSIGGNAFENGLSGAYHLALTSPVTSILLIFAGGQIISAYASLDIPVISLPEEVNIEGTDYTLGDLFPNGLKAGENLAQTGQDFEFNGLVSMANQSLFAGGGDSNKPAGFTFIDLGTNTLGIMISNGQIVSIVSQAAITFGELPLTISVDVKLPNDTIETTSIPFRSNFPNGLIVGMNYANGISRYGNDALIASIAGLTTAANQGIYTTGSGTAATYPLSPFGRSLVGTADAAAARSILGVSSSSGLLSAIGALTPSNNEGLLFTGPNTATTFPLTAYGRTLTGSADATAARTALGALINALGSLSTSDNLGMYFTGSSSIATFPFTAFGRSFVGSSTQENARTALGGVASFGVASSSDVQAGTANDRVITPAALSSLPKSMTGDGYKMFQDGFIIQWGNIATGIGETATTQSFPLTFPNNCFAVIPVAKNASNNSEHDFFMQVSSMTTSQVTIYHNSADADSGASNGWYIAVGN